VVPDVGLVVAELPLVPTVPVDPDGGLVVAEVPLVPTVPVVPDVGAVVVAVPLVPDVVVTTGCQSTVTVSSTDEHPSADPAQPV